MKDLTALRFLQIVLEDDSELHTIRGRDISYVKKQLINTSIRPDFSTREFNVIARVYPQHIIVSDTGITINGRKELVGILKQKLVYSQDRDMDIQVKKIWKKRNEF